MTGWMADQRLTGFRTASPIAEQTRWKILMASTMPFLCLWDSYLIDWMTDQTPTVGLRAVKSASQIDLLPLRAG